MIGQVSNQLIKLGDSNEACCIWVILDPCLNKDSDQLLVCYSCVSNACTAEGIHDDGDHEIEIDLGNQDVEDGEEEI